MMIQITIALLSGILLLTACAGTPPLAQPTVASVSKTSTPSPLPSATPTITVTPLPTIPTFTPTFDVSTIVKVTPAPKAECPKIDSTISPEIYLPEKLEYPSANSDKLVLNYLNKGGNAETLVKRLEQIYPINEFRGGYAFNDLTGDQNYEFLYVDLFYNGKPLVFSCKNGEFSVLAILSGKYDHDFYKTEIEELVPDGLPEIIVEGTSGVSFPISTFYIYKWDGRVFALLEQITFKAIRQREIKDIDENGTKEIILIGDNPTCTSCSNFIPQRERTIILSWNGKEFVEITNEFETPTYRFQAVQDADAAANIGHYDKAVLLYNQVTSDSGLGWWSPDRLFYEQTIHDPVTMFIETPSVTPAPDPTEYPRIAAYAYYRIMLLQFAQNQETEATTTYNTLQQEFGNDPYAHPYVDMASAFWEAYQSTHRMYDGCAAAIQYAVEHPNILIPLGSDYHGSQAKIYKPEDVCPFR